MSNPKEDSKRKKKASSVPTSLPVIRPMVAGVDIGSSQHWVCGPAKADDTPNVCVFGTTTAQLNELADQAQTSPHFLRKVTLSRGYDYVQGPQSPAASRSRSGAMVLGRVALPPLFGWRRSPSSAPKAPSGLPSDESPATKVAQ
jgi:hypothetical protein